jgi:sugar phosphate permease
MGGVVRYVWHTRTNVAIIVSSALGYYLFAGIRAFGVEFADKHYGVSQGLSTTLLVVLGSIAIVGVLVGGRLSDSLLSKGHVNARLVVPAIATFITAVAFVPGVLTTSLVVALPLLTAAGFGLAMANPPLDAARLDVVPPLLWGRAESFRTVVRTSLEALAPLLFGAVAQHVFGGESGTGLQWTFLVMTIPLFVSGVVLLVARRWYARDVPTADASARGTNDRGGAATPQHERA